MLHLFFFKKAIKLNVGFIHQKHESNLWFFFPPKPKFISKLLYKILADKTFSSIALNKLRYISNTKNKWQSTFNNLKSTRDVLWVKKILKTFILGLISGNGPSITSLFSIEPTILLFSRWKDLCDFRQYLDFEFLNNFFIPLRLGETWW